MSEEIEQQTQPFDFGRYLDIVRRRHIHFLVPLFLGWLLIWGSSWFLPARYKSGTLILVEQPSMPKNYVEPNVNDDLQARLQSITQQILSRTRLLLIIDKLHLYNDRHKVRTPDEKVELMRKDIDIELVREAQGDAIHAFRVSYTSRDPHIAQQVTNELTSLFIDENSRVREQESEETTAFIKSQLETARSNLADQDAKVRAFQSAHEGELPTQQASNLQILSGLQSQLQSEQDALNAAKQHKVYSESLITQYRAAPGTTRTVTGMPTGLAAIDLQLDTLRSKLANLSARYTDQYPEVRELKEEIRKTEKTREQIIASLKSVPDGKDRKVESDAREAIDPVQNAPLLQLKNQLQADQLEIGNRERAIASLQARINEYQGRLSAEPAVEQQLADLTRGSEQSQVNYNGLLKKENDSQMATSMEQMQAGERFMVLDPPSLPQKPDFPNRLKMCGMGLGVGAVLGLLVVVVLELPDDRMHSEMQIQGVLPVAIISEVPEIVTPLDVRRGKMKMALGWVAAALVISVILAGSAVSYLHD
jgi:polysaccharide chain length determinant protein (PEP-CTERM system associated)